MAHSNPIRDSVLQAIGNTPVVRLRKLVTPSGFKYLAGDLYQT